MCDLTPSVSALPQSPKRHADLGWGRRLLSSGAGSPGGGAHRSVQQTVLRKVTRGEATLECLGSQAQPLLQFQPLASLTRRPLHGSEGAARQIGDLFSPSLSTELKSNNVALSALPKAFPRGILRLER